MLLKSARTSDAGTSGTSAPSRMVCALHDCISLSALIVGFTNGASRDALLRELSARTVPERSRNRQIWVTASDFCKTRKKRVVARVNEGR